MKEALIECTSKNLPSEHLINGKDFSVNTGLLGHFHIVLYDGTSLGLANEM